MNYIALIENSSLKDKVDRNIRPIWIFRKDNTFIGNFQRIPQHINWSSGDNMNHRQWLNVDISFDKWSQVIALIKLVHNITLSWYTVYANRILSEVNILGFPISHGNWTQRTQDVSRNFPESQRGWKHVLPLHTCICFYISTYLQIFTSLNDNHCGSVW